ncbi:hypothetical protein HYE68_001444 [Fusarium pseudograminearum]|nr:hypothetical protein HYE68_001444 [Fusarium pseudograminearum]
MVPPAPKFTDYAEAKAAWHVARAEFHETAAKRHREWLQKLEEEEANEPSIEELIAQAEIEAKKAAVS